jgi:hypothetical protein
VCIRRVLIVTIDTLRADRLGVYGAKNVETPNIDRLPSWPSASSVRGFPRARSSRPRSSIDRELGAGMRAFPHL